MNLVLDTVPAPGPLPTSWAAADLLTTDLRAVLANVTEAQEWCVGGAGDWSGATAEAAEHAQTAMARELDVAQAALEIAARAAGTFAAEVQRLQQELDHELEPGYRVLLEQSTTLATRTATTEGEVAALEADVRAFNGAVATFRSDIAAWRAAVQAAEEAFVQALQTADTTAEAEGVADLPGRVDPDPLAATLDRLDDPAAARAYWDDLTYDQQRALLEQHPDVVGNTDGIPVATRDEANRAALARDLDYLARRAADGQLTGPEQEHLENARAVQRIVDDYAEDYDPVTGQHLLHLVGYDPAIHSDDGGIIVSMGDPDRADHVATYVPGTTKEVQTISGSVGSVHTLYEEARADLQDGSVATLLWLDYDAPSLDGVSMDELADIASVASSPASEDAGRHLAGFVDGLRESRGVGIDGARLPDAHLTLIGHSYGATTSAWAAHQGAPVDELVLLGSPGAPTATADELTGADVYVGAAAYDPVSLLGQGVRGGDIPAHHHDPAQASFGAERIEVDSGSYRAQDLLANHSSYFSGVSLGNVAAVVSGNDPTLVDGRGPLNYQTLPEVLGGTAAASLGDASASAAEWLWKELVVP